MTQFIHSILLDLVNGSMLKELIKDIRSYIDYKIWCILLTKDSCVGFKRLIFLSTKQRGLDFKKGIFNLS